MCWSKLKKRAKEFLADSVRDRVDFHNTRYRNYYGDNDHGRAWITVDGREITNMAYDYYWWSGGDVECDDKSIFGQHRLGSALFTCLTTSIDDVLTHEDGLVRALGMLDRRVGKRRLSSFDLRDAPPLSQFFFILRCEAENIPIPDYLAGRKDDLLQRLRNKNLYRKKRQPQEQAQRAALLEAATEKLAKTGTDNLRPVNGTPFSSCPGPLFRPRRPALGPGVRTGRRQATGRRNRGNAFGDAVFRRPILA